MYTLQCFCRNIMNCCMPDNSNQYIQPLEENYFKEKVKSTVFVVPLVNSISNLEKSISKHVLSFENVQFPIFSVYILKASGHV